MCPPAPRRDAARVGLVLVLVLSLLAAAPLAAAVDRQPLDSGETFCIGSRLTVETPAAEELWRVDGDRVGVYESRDGRITVDTADLAPGRYVLRDERTDPPYVVEDGTVTRTGDAEAAAFTLERCDPEARFLPGRLEARQGTVPNATLLLDFPRRDGAVDLRSAMVDAETLAGLVGGTVTDDGVRVSRDEEVVFEVPYDRACALPGRLVLQVTGARSGTSDSAVLFVDTPEADRYTVDRDAGAVTLGESIGLSLSVRGCSDAVTVRVAGDGVVLTGRVTDADDDGQVDLQLATGALPGTPAEAVRVGAGDAVTDVSLEGETFSPGSYRVTLETERRVRDATSVLVRQPTTTTTTPTPTTTTTTPTPTTTTASTTTPTTPTTTTASTTTSGETTTEVLGPGFGLPVAVLAVALAVLFGRRR